jgi:catechol 2,3-dioxygenase-like lactoylglutathione lyase family enzyme
MAELFQRIDTVFIKVRDLDKAVEWYTKILGLKLRWKNDEGGYAAIEMGGAPITFVVEKDSEKFKPYEDAPFIIYARDIVEAHNSLHSQNVEVGAIETLYDSKWFWFKDQDGNVERVCYYKE